MLRTETHDLPRGLLNRGSFCFFNAVLQVQHSLGFWIWVVSAAFPYVSTFSLNCMHIRSLSLPFALFKSMPFRSMLGGCQRNLPVI